MMKRVKTLQLGNRLFIFDGINHLRYVDLEKNKVHVYKPPKKPFKFTYMIKPKENGTEKDGNI